MSKNNILKASFVYVHLNNVMFENVFLQWLFNKWPSWQLRSYCNCGVVIAGIAGDHVKFAHQMDTNYTKLLYIGATLAQNISGLSKLCLKVLISGVHLKNI